MDVMDEEVEEVGGYVDIEIKKKVNDGGFACTRGRMDYVMRT